MTTLRFTPATQPTTRATWTVRYLGSYPDIGIYDRAGNPAQPMTQTVRVGPGAGYGPYGREDPRRLGLALSHIPSSLPPSPPWRVPSGCCN